jgi:hypothetical protein
MWDILQRSGVTEEDPKKAAMLEVHRIGRSSVSAQSQRKTKRSTPSFHRLLSPLSEPIDHS